METNLLLINQGSGHHELNCLENVFSILWRSLAQAYTSKIQLELKLPAGLAQLGCTFELS